MSASVRNPVLDRELKERLRTRRATIVITVYLAILGLILYAIYRSEVSSAINGFGGGPIASQSADLGRTLFEALVLVMLTLVLFIVPGLTADALTGERERQTLVPLQVTLLRPRSIVLGKLLASLAFVSLLVVATLPMLGISFVFGGVTVGQVARAVAAVLATGVVVASLALLCSSIARRTQGAMVLAYGMALFLALGAPVIYLGQRAVDDAGAHPAPTVLLLNPFVATADAVAPPDGVDTGVDSPLRSLSRGVRNLEDSAGRSASGVLDREGRVVALGDVGVEPGSGPVGFVATDELVVDGQVQPGGPFVIEERRRSQGIPFWARSVAALGGLSLIGLVVATYRITTPSDRSAA